MINVEMRCKGLYDYMLTMVVCGSRINESSLDIRGMNLDLT